MTSTDSVDNIEEVSSAPDVQCVNPETGIDNGVYHRESRGGELIPRSPLPPSLGNIICSCAVFHIAAGTVMTIMGMLIFGLMGKYSARHGPVMWWGGLGPFILGVLGLYAASSRSRRYTYLWGMGSLLLAVTQTAVMGWVGNFTTSHYDVWPLHVWRNGLAVCSMRAKKCFCQDYYHGVYSGMELPGVNYLYKDGIKWRQTIYDTCNHAGLITMLFYVFHACWGIFIVSSFIACIIAFASSVCAKPDGGKFERLKEEGGEDDEEERLHQGTRHDSNMQELQVQQPHSVETVEIHGRF